MALRELVFPVGVVAVTIGLLRETLWVWLVGVVLMYMLQKLVLTLSETRLPPTGKYILITGCDTGFGNGLAKRLDEAGCHVIAACLSQNGDGATKLKTTGSSRMLVVEMDVRNDDSVAKCVEKVTKHCGEKGLWALVNNAGIVRLGDIEFLTMDMYHEVAEVNLYGVIRVTKAFLPLIRKAQDGRRIVNVTSVTGLISVALRSAYDVTKHGTESFSDILRQEMEKFNIAVSVVEPGRFRKATDIVNMQKCRDDNDRMWQTASDDVKQLYGKDYLEKQYNALKKGDEEPSMSMEPVLLALERAVLADPPPCRQLVDGGSFDKYCLLARMSPFFSTSTFDWAMKKLK